MSRGAVAGVDIVCTKVLREVGPGTFITPYRSKVVGGLGEIVGLPVGRGYEEAFDGGRYFTYGAGWVHAYVGPVEGGKRMDVRDDLFRAVIPAGTPFVLGCSGDEVCSARMLVTGRGCCDFTPLHEVAGMCGVFGDDGVSPGWLVLSDGSFVHPLSGSLDAGDVIGVVCGSFDGKLLVMSSSEFFGDYEVCHCHCVRHSIGFTKPGDWCMPSLRMMDVLHGNRTAVFAGLSAVGDALCGPSYWVWERCLYRNYVYDVYNYSKRFKWDIKFASMPCRAFMLMEC